MSNLMNGIAGILVAISPNYVSLLVFRTLYGFGVKGGWVAGYVLSKKLFHFFVCQSKKNFYFIVIRNVNALEHRVVKSALKHTFSAVVSPIHIFHNQLCSVRLLCALCPL